MKRASLKAFSFSTAIKKSLDLPLDNRNVYYWINVSTLNEKFAAESEASLISGGNFSLHRSPAFNLKPSIQ